MYKLLCNTLVLSVLSMFVVSTGYAQSQEEVQEKQATSQEIVAATMQDSPYYFSGTSSLLEFANKEPIVVPGDDNGTELITRTVEEPTVLNILAYGVRQAVNMGLSVETIVLILMIPVLASMVTITRNLIGLPSLDTLVVISFSIALLASNIVTGTLLLAIILLASIVARIVLKNVKIMQQPKITLSMLLVSSVVLVALYVFAASGLVPVASISVVPVLLLIIMSERIVRLQFESNPNHAWTTVFVTLILGIGGYYLLLLESVRSFVINYPEIILLVIPLNVYIGRYFGLRLMERFRFSDILKNKE